MPPVPPVPKRVAAATAMRRVNDPCPVAEKVDARELHDLLGTGSFGKHTKKHGKSPSHSWANQRTNWPCSIAMLVYQRVHIMVT